MKNDAEYNKKNQERAAKNRFMTKEFTDAGIMEKKPMSAERRRKKRQRDLAYSRKRRATERFIKDCMEGQRSKIQYPPLKDHEVAEEIQLEETDPEDVQPPPQRQRLRASGDVWTISRCRPWGTEGQALAPASD